MPPSAPSKPQRTPRPATDAPAASLRDRLKEATAREILRAAETVIAEQGFAAAAMAKVAQEAGVSVGTLYNYFEDKNELLSSLLAVRRDELVECFDAVGAAQRGAAFEPRLRATMGAIFAHFGARRNFLRIVLDAEIPKIAKPAKSEDGATDGSRSTRAFLERWRSVVDQGVAEGALGAVDAGMAAAMLSGMIRGLLAELLEDATRSFAEAAALAVEAFLHGVASRP